MPKASKYPRLKQFIKDYFPDKDTTQQDIREWAQNEVPAWPYISKKAQKDILNDWREFIKPEFVEKEIEKGEIAWKEAKKEWKEVKKEFGVGFVDKVKRWFKRLF